MSVNLDEDFNMEYLDMDSEESQELITAVEDEVDLYVTTYIIAF